MNKPVLVVMAAGMGSRYGGMKQIDPVGPCGQVIVDYSLYDARRGTHLLGKGRMLRAYPKLKHGQSNRSLSSLLEQLEDEYPDSFNGFGIQ